MKERHYTREHHYKGPVEVWVDGAQRLRGGDTPHQTRERGRNPDVSAERNPWSSPTTWDGRFRGVAQEDLRRLQVDGEFELRLTDGSVGQAVLPNGRDLAYLQGLGDPALLAVADLRNKVGSPSARSRPECVRRPKRATKFIDSLS